MTPRQYLGALVFAIMGAFYIWAMVARLGWKSAAKLVVFLVLVILSTFLGCYLLSPEK